MANLLDVIKENEIKGRMVFSNFIKNKYGEDVVIEQPSITSPIDLYFTYKGNRYGVEIKERDDKYLKYDTHILEEIKLNNVFNHIHDCREIYYAFIFSKKLFVYPLYEIKGMIDNGTIQKKTSRYRKNHWSMDYVTKNVYEIPTSYAKQYEIKTDFINV